MNKKIVSYENSLRLLERKEQVHAKIEDLLFSGIYETQKAAISHLNKAVYDLAEEQGCSVWDVCFNFFPEWGPKVRFKDSNTPPTAYEYEVRSEIKLVPLELEFEKGPGYWKDKYLRLKEKMQDLIDGKDE